MFLPRVSTVRRVACYHASNHEKVRGREEGSEGKGRGRQDRTGRDNRIGYDRTRSMFARLRSRLRCTVSVWHTVLTRYTADI